MVYLTNFYLLLNYYLHFDFLILILHYFVEAFDFVVGNIAVNYNFAEIFVSIVVVVGNIVVYYNFVEVVENIDVVVGNIVVVAGNVVELVENIVVNYNFVVYYNFVVNYNFVVVVVVNIFVEDIVVYYNFVVAVVDNFAVYYYHFFVF
jgi:hypothetical protein